MDAATAERFREPENRWRLSDHASGPLLVWSWPDPGRRYVIGADTAGGGPDGDECCAVVIDAKTCDVVAAMADRCQPIPWGRKLALLGWLFMEALLSVEVYPSTHGMSAINAAKAFGYQRFHYRRQRERAGSPMTMMLGFRTDSSTKPQLVARAKEAVSARNDLPWERLVLQLRALRWDPVMPNKLKRKQKDDLFDAWGIAVMSRDDAWTQGKLNPPEKAPATETEIFWHHRNKRLGAPRKRRRRYIGNV